MAVLSIISAPLLFCAGYMLLSLGCPPSLPHPHPHPNLIHSPLSLLIPEDYSNSLIVWPNIGFGQIKSSLGEKRAEGKGNWDVLFYFLTLGHVSVSSFLSPPLLPRNYLQLPLSVPSSVISFLTGLQYREVLPWTLQI